MTRQQKEQRLHALHQQLRKVYDELEAAEGRVKLLELQAAELYRSIEETESNE
jgi:hypothetical protein